MVQGMLGGTEIELVCPQCREQHFKTIGWLRDHEEFPCGCGGMIETKRFAADIQKAEQAVQQIKRVIEELGK